MLRPANRSFKNLRKKLETKAHDKLDTKAHDKLDDFIKDNSRLVGIEHASVGMMEQIVENEKKWRILSESVAIVTLRPKKQRWNTDM